MKTIIILILFLVTLPALLWADASIYPLKIVGRKEVIVTTPRVSLSDVAEVSSQRVGDDETVIGLKKIMIEESPAPGETLTLSATQLLAKLQEQGVDLAKVGYSLPRITTIKRASRTITADEIRGVIQSFLQNSNRDATLKQIELPREVHLLPGLTAIKAISAVPTIPGKIGFTLSAHVENSAPVTFNVNALIDEWREVPVAKRPIAKGNTIQGDDLVMARLNTTQIPRDIIQASNQVLGFEANQALNSGEFFRTAKLSVPAVIQAGERITMIYRKGFLEASAKGIALEAGSIGQLVKIRNESSKKVITGKVKDSGLVEVQP